MAGGSPNLFPSGFLEFTDSCNGPLLYRDQPSRESSGVVLSNFMNKYVTRNEKFNPTRTLNYIQYLNNNWGKLDKDLKKDVLKLLKDSNGSIGKEMENSKNKNNLNNFGETIKEFFSDEPDERPGRTPGITLKAHSNTNNIIIILVVAITSIVLGFMICSLSGGQSQR